MDENNEDKRSFGTLIRQFREYEAIKGKLVRDGILNGNASHEQVQDALRRLLPAEAFAKRKAPA